MSSLKLRLPVLLVVLSVIAVLALGCGSSPSPAQPAKEAPKAEAKAEPVKAKYPTKPIHMVIARPAGGSMDQQMRKLQPFLSKHVGANVVIDNVAGAGGKIGNGQVYQAAPDGYTLLVCNNPSDILNQVVTPNLPYDITKFTPIYGFSGGVSTTLLVNKKSNIKSLDELVKAGKAKKMTMASTMGVSGSSFAYTLFAKATGVRFEKIPFDSGNEALISTMGGHTDVTFCSSADAVTADKKNINLLTVFLDKRLKALPDLPTFSESYPGVYYEATLGIIGPPNMPKEIVDILAGAMEKSCQDPEFIKAAGDQFEVVPVKPADYGKQIADLLKNSAAVKDLLLEFVTDATAPAAKDAAKGKK